MTLDGLDFQLDFRRVGPDSDTRSRNLREIVSANAHLSAVGIDGPLGPNCRTVNRYRSAEAILSRGLFQHRCKPAPTNPKNQNSQDFQRHTRKLASLVKQLQHDAHIVEAFPDAFLAVLLHDTDHKRIKHGRGKSDRYYVRAVEGGYLRKLIEKIAGVTPPDKYLETVEHHDNRAAFVCALTAMCEFKNRYVAVGDSIDGNITLPLTEVWGSSGDGSNSQTLWAQTVLQKNLCSVRKRPGKHRHLRQGEVIRNGSNWLEERA